MGANFCIFGINCAFDDGFLTSLEPMARTRDKLIFVLIVTGSGSPFLLFPVRPRKGLDDNIIR